MSDPRIEALIDRSDLPPAAQADVRVSINSSPYLQEVMLKGIEDSRIQKFALSKNANEGGHYDRQAGTISINPEYFGIELKEQRLDALTGVIGHEAGHGLMARSAEITEYRYAYQVEQAIKDAFRNGELGVNITPIAQQALGHRPVNFDTQHHAYFFQRFIHNSRRENGKTLASPRAQNLH